MIKSVKDKSRICAICHCTTTSKISVIHRFRNNFSELYFHEECKIKWDNMQLDPIFDFDNWTGVDRFLKGGN